MRDVKSGGETRREGADMLKFIVSPWKNDFVSILRRTREELFISSPFIDSEGINVLLKTIPYPNQVRISIITDLSINNIRNRGISPAGLLRLYERVRELNVSSLGRLHAKVYLIDNRAAVITSANLTSSGLTSNFEYGVLVEDEESVESIRKDMEQYFSWGNKFTVETLRRIAEMSEEIWKLQREVEKENKDSELTRRLKEKTEELNIEILKNRVRGGKTINSIFSETIIYLLKKKGPLSTEELHPLIQTIHPDICDDSIDYVINGQNFGKKWKHYVRDAQVYLKKKGLIKLGEDGKWYLVEKR